MLLYLQQYLYLIEAQKRTRLASEDTAAAGIATISDATRQQLDQLAI
jgi:hypothetical protein